MSLKALIFDVDGTLAETEELHRAAFNQAFSEAGIDWHWTQDDYAILLKVTGGKERILAHAKTIGTHNIDPAPLHLRKTALYNAHLRAGALPLRPGVERLIRSARVAGLKLAIATTTSRENIHTLLDVSFGHEARSWFSAICTGEDVTLKKPDPEVYQLALERLGLHASACLAFEDTRNGILAARGAGLDVVVTPSRYSANENFSGALAVIPTLESHLIKSEQSLAPLASLIA
jgi:HAD superfamily hydrolase (TIGR01509 family)